VCVGRIRTVVLLCPGPSLFSFGFLGQLELGHVVIACMVCDEETSQVCDL
jgi:hypothetical protein